MYKHNKKKNTCIVYEQLLTLASRLAVQKQVNEFNFVIGLTKKYFNPNTSLGKERRAIRSLTESRHERGDAEGEKIALINEISRTIGSEMFKIPIKNYKIYASAQILANEERNGFKHTSPDERLKIKKVLRENMSCTEEKEPEVEVDSFTYKVLVNKFNQKYGPFINEDQKNILSAWIRYLVTEDESVISPVLKEKLEKIHSVIKSSLRDKSHKVSEYYELLKEADQSLKERQANLVVDEEVVYEAMRYFDLIEDLK